MPTKSLCLSRTPWPSRRSRCCEDQLSKANAYLEEQVRTEHNFGEIIGDNAVLRRVLREVETVAATGSTVLIRGETGTGKELIARAVHDLSPRQGRTLVKLNCAAIPTGLLESELFGHEKGAFTGAISQKVGRIRAGAPGDAVPRRDRRHPPELQPKLLRVLQEQEFERLGSTKTIKVDVRLVAATNRDLAAMVADGRFRSDLYYRLNVFPLVLPPCASAAKTSRGWSAISLSISPGGWAGGSRSSRPRSWTPWFGYPGRATSESCKTSSNAESSSPPVRRCRSPSATCSCGDAGLSANRRCSHARRGRAGTHPRCPARYRLGGGWFQGGRGPPGDEAIHVV